MALGNAQGQGDPLSPENNESAANGVSDLQEGQGSGADDTIEKASSSFSILTQPPAGSVANNSDGTFSFDPGADFQDLAVGESRSVSFTFLLAQSEVVSATVTVTGTSDGPIATDVQYNSLGAADPDMAAESAPAAPEAGPPAAETEEPGLEPFFDMTPAAPEPAPMSEAPPAMPVAQDSTPQETVFESAAPAEPARTEGDQDSLYAEAAAQDAGGEAFAASESASFEPVSAPEDDSPVPTAPSAADAWDQNPVPAGDTADEASPWDVVSPEVAAVQWSDAAPAEDSAGMSNDSAAESQASSDAWDAWGTPETEVTETTFGGEAASDFAAPAMQDAEPTDGFGSEFAVPEAAASTEAAPADPEASPNADSFGQPSASDGLGDDPWASFDAGSGGDAWAQTTPSEPEAFTPEASAPAVAESEPEAPAQNDGFASFEEQASEPETPVAEMQAETSDYDAPDAAAAEFAASGFETPAEPDAQMSDPVPAADPMTAPAPMAEAPFDEPASEVPATPAQSNADDGCIINQPEAGRAVDNGDGTFDFDPGEDFNDLAPGETRDVTFGVRLPTGEEYQARVTVAGDQAGPFAKDVAFERMPEAVAESQPAPAEVAFEPAPIEPEQQGAFEPAAEPVGDAQEPTPEPVAEQAENDTASSDFAGFGGGFGAASDEPDLGEIPASDPAPAATDWPAGDAPSFSDIEPSALALEESADPGLAPAGDAPAGPAGSAEATEDAGSFMTGFGGSDWPEENPAPEAEAASPASETPSDGFGTGFALEPEAEPEAAPETPDPAGFETTEASLAPAEPQMAEPQAPVTTRESEPLADRPLEAGSIWDSAPSPAMESAPAAADQSISELLSASDPAPAVEAAPAVESRPDTLKLSGVTAGPGVGGWNIHLTSGEILEEAAGSVSLSPGAAGTLQLDDSAVQISFNGIERIVW